MSLDFLTMDDIPSGFPRGNGYPPHNPYELNGQFPQLPAYNAFQGPFPPQHPGAPPNGPMAPRNSTSHMPHGAMPPPAAARRKSSADANRPVRKRITRACDQCNQLRTKCDGQQPCTHCTELGIECQYKREQKKRGKASRKELAERAHKDGAGSGAGSDKATDTSTKKKAKKSEAAAIRLSRQAPHPPPSFAPAARSTPMESIPGTSVLSNSGEPRSFYGEHMPANGGMYANEFVPVYDGMQPDESGDASGDFTGSEQSFSTYAGRFSYRHGPPSEALSNGHQMAHAGQPESASFQGVGKFGEEPVSMEGFASNWQNAIPSSQGPYFPSSFPAATFGQTSLRYPVLEPLVPHLSNIIPVPLACELMEYYFTSASAAHQHPSCPYILGYLYRKQSFFHPTSPRKCKPALLASMLWVAAQNSESIALTSVASARAQACRKLLKLTLDLLKPISQNMPWGVAPSGESMAGGVDIDDLANGMDGNAQTMSMDDIVAHMHIATVMSASERKASSIRWWTLAWSLARELKLSKELPTSGPLSTVSPEEREERRRVWWMLYMVDRHLALCYNRPLHFLDTECQSLKLPMDEVNWQQGYYESDSFAESDDEVEPEGRGIEQFQCRGHSVFGFFLPLMFILGNIVNLHHDKSHPTFGEDFHDPSHWNAQTVKITQYLQIFDDSLRSFHKAQRAKMPKGSPELDMDGKERPRTDPQTRVVLTYSTYILHVMHILLAGKWDPIELLDDSEAWISSQAFLTATSHAVSAAESLGEILNLDPSLEFMPFFFGAYLLQGSFLLFLIADRLKSEADPEVIKACQTIIRAHDACVATLNTDYQRNFCKVMRNTLAAARPGYAQDDFTQQVKRRELLAKYRWTGDGTGLAL